MQNFIEKLKFHVNKFMEGRNGQDNLCRISLAVGLVLAILDALTGSGIFSIFALIFIVYALFRFLSKNIKQRKTENDKCIDAFRSIKSTFKRYVTRVKNCKTTKYFTCKKCGQRLTVPKGKGALRITCPKCGQTEVIRS